MSDKIKRISGSFQLVIAICLLVLSCRSTASSTPSEQSNIFPPSLDQLASHKLPWAQSILAKYQNNEINIDQYIDAENTELLSMSESDKRTWFNNIGFYQLLKSESSDVKRLQSIASLMIRCFEKDNTLLSPANCTDMAPAIDIIMLYARLTQNPDSTQTGQKDIDPEHMDFAYQLALFTYITSIKTRCDTLERVCLDQETYTKHTGKAYQDSDLLNQELSSTLVHTKTDLELLRNSPLINRIHPLGIALYERDLQCRYDKENKVFVVISSSICGQTGQSINMPYHADRITFEDAVLLRHVPKDQIVIVNHESLDNFKHLLANLDLFPNSCPPLKRHSNKNIITFEDYNKYKESMNQTTEQPPLKYEEIITQGYQSPEEIAQEIQKKQAQQKKHEEQLRRHWEEQERQRLKRQIPQAVIQSKQEKPYSERLLERKEAQKQLQIAQEKKETTAILSSGIFISIVHLLGTISALIFTPHFMALYLLPINILIVSLVPLLLLHIHNKLANPNKAPKPWQYYLFFSIIGITIIALSTIFIFNSIAYAQTSEYTLFESISLAYQIFAIFSIIGCLGIRRLFNNIQRSYWLLYVQAFLLATIALLFSLSNSIFDLPAYSQLLLKSHILTVSGLLFIAGAFIHLLGHCLDEEPINQSKRSSFDKLIKIYSMHIILSALIGLTIWLTISYNLITPNIS
ncbi:hypothetical protein NEHOM01_0255 [Nematocida homosporus]|uniref:uncharacterized protein n=1 Tax=Nematocida homosporus TaxID=1912981 RepID=UPI00221EC11E|nr:uncharacterized protein NEHOM01_0255 [Nematocida homosporus]KAI5184580.1 hypothetical protein NEHOM01_0255 [Nematocida homosporus]